MTMSLLLLEVYCCLKTIFHLL